MIAPKLNLVLLGAHYRVSISGSNKIGGKACPTVLLLDMYRTIMRIRLFEARVRDLATANEIPGFSYNSRVQILLVFRTHHLAKRDENNREGIAGYSSLICAKSAFRRLAISGTSS